MSIRNLRARRRRLGRRRRRRAFKIETPKLRASARRPRARQERRDSDTVCKALIAEREWRVNSATVLIEPVERARARRA